MQGILKIAVIVTLFGQACGEKNRDETNVNLYNYEAERFSQSIDSSEVYINEALQYRDDGDFLNAMVSISRAIELNPLRAEVHYASGLIKAAMNDYEGAVVDYSQAINLNPNYSDVYAARGIVKARLNDYRGAMADINQAIELDPDDPQSYYYRGIVKGVQGDLRGAIVDYSQAIDLNPDFAEAYFGRGGARILTDRNGACLDLSKAGELGLSEVYDIIRQECN